MEIMPYSARQDFEKFHAAGMAFKDAGEHQKALIKFEQADELARLYGDHCKRLDALNPAARALWSLEQYDPAAGKLSQAARIAEKLGLMDEWAMAWSNLGRLAAVKAVRLVPVKQLPEALKEESLQWFRDAHEILATHPHLYFGYANATHGSVIAALAGERRFALDLVRHGESVAHKVSMEPYDQKTPSQISPNGLQLLKAARYLIPLGNMTPILAARARAEIAR